MDCENCILTVVGKTTLCHKFKTKTDRCISVPSKAEIPRVTRTVMSLSLLTNGRVEIGRCEQVFRVNMVIITRLLPHTQRQAHYLRPKVSNEMLLVPKVMR